MPRERITPEVYTIAKRIFAEEAPASWDLTDDELDAANQRVAERMNIDVDRVQAMLIWGPDRA